MLQHFPTHYEVTAEYKQYSQTEKKLSISTSEMHRKAMFEIGNTYTSSDGRTYVSIDQNGEYQSCFVSQYSNIIDTNIEPKIRGVCKALHKRGYLTFGSCQGHEDSKLRWVGVVFNTSDQKQKFIYEINAFDLDIHFYDNHINSKQRPKKSEPWFSDSVTLHIVWNQPSLENCSIDEKRNYPYTDAELTKFWNIQMGRCYTHYESVIFTIGRQMVYDNWWKDFIIRWRYDVSYIDSITKTLEEKIYSLPYYDG
jgi:hypothetical protein